MQKFIETFYSDDKTEQMLADIASKERRSKSQTIRLLIEQAYQKLEVKDE